MPAAPLVGAVTTRPPAAFSSLTASANSVTQSMTRSGSAAKCSAAKRPVQLGGPAAHLQPTGQTPVGGAAAAHAVLHDLPDVQQPGAYVGLGAPGQLVGQHDVAEIGSPVASVWASSSAPVRNGYATGVSSTLIRSAPVAVSSTTKPPPTE